MVRVASTIALLATAGAGVEAFQAPNVGYSQAVAHQPIARAFSRRSRAAATTLHPGDDFSIAEEEERQAVPEIPTIEEVGLDVTATSTILDAATANVEVPDFSDVLIDEDKAEAREGDEQPSQAATIMHDLKTMTLPLLAVWLSNPLLSLIDTAAVGKVSTVLQLASLGPATAVCDTGGYVFSFLSVVTTGLVANAVARGYEEASDRYTNDALIGSLICGAGMAAMLLGPTGVPLMRSFLGGASMTTASAALLPGAMAYAKIRAIGFIPSLMAAQLQSSFLARRNVKLPLIAVAVASVVNLFGDYLLVVKGGMGAAGAAWATVGAQVIGLGVLAHAEHTRRSGRVIDKRSLALRMRGLEKYFKKCVSPALALLGRAGIAISMASTASGIGTIAVAAHQILYSVFALFCPMGEAIAQTVMNLLPRAMADDGTEDGSESEGVVALGASGRSLVKAMAGVALILGGLDAVAALALPMCLPHLFTSSSAVAQALFATAPYMAVTLTVHSLASMFEGVLFATGDAKFLGCVYPINCVLVTLACAAMKSSIDLKMLWMIYVSSIALRGGQFWAKYMWTNRQPSAGADTADGDHRDVDEVLATAKSQAVTDEGLALVQSLVDMAATVTPTVPDIPLSPHHGREHYLHAKTA